MKVRCAAVLLLVLSSAAPSAEPSIQFELRNGRVWLTARGASVGAILEVWARAGGVRIVNGDALSPAPLTLQLTAVPERTALETILRDAAGYVAATKDAPSAQSSTFDRILILPASHRPAPSADAAGARRATRAATRAEDALPEPLAALVRTGIAGLPAGDTADAGGQAELPEALTELMQAMNPSAPAPAPELPAGSPAPLPAALDDLIRAASRMAAPGSAQPPAGALPR